MLFNGNKVFISVIVLNLATLVANVLCTFFNYFKVSMFSKI